MNFSPTPEEGHSGLLQNNRLQSPKHLNVNFRCLGTKNNQAKVLRNPAKNEFQVSQSSSKTKDLEYPSAILALFNKFSRKLSPVDKEGGWV